MTTQAIISSTGVYHPESIIHNDELVTSYNAYVDKFNQANAQAIQNSEQQALEYSSSEFILKASGINQRYVLDKSGILDIERMRPLISKRSDDELSLHAEFALKAIKVCLEKAGKLGPEVDCVIMACSNFQRPYPAVSIEVQNQLGAKGFAFDMNVACSSATFALSIAKNMVETNQAKCVLVVNPEICTAHLDFTNRESHFIFGDASTAILIESEKNASSNNQWAIKSAQLSTEFSNNIRNNQGFITICESKNQMVEPELFYQNGRKVFKEVVPKAFEHILSHCEKHGLNSEDLSRYWLHQANSHMNLLIAKKLLGVEPSLTHAPIILDKYANTASCGSIIAFDHYNDDLKSGDMGILCSFGAGYSIGSLLLKKR